MDDLWNFDILQDWENTWCTDIIDCREQLAGENRRLKELEKEPMPAECTCTEYTEPNWMVYAQLRSKYAEKRLLKLGYQWYWYKGELVFWLNKEGDSDGYDLDHAELLALDYCKQ